MTPHLSANADASPVAGDEPERVHAMFFVAAEAHPGMTARLVEPFAKLGLVPSRVHISSEDGNGEELAADLRAQDVTRECAHLIAKALGRIVGVRQVISLAE